MITSAGGAVHLPEGEGGLGQRRATDGVQEAADLAGGVDGPRRRLLLAAAVADGKYVGGGQRERLVEIAARACGEKAPGDGLGLLRVGVVTRTPFLDVTPGAPAEPAHGGFGTVQCLGDLPVRVAEGIPQHEDGPLRRGERLQQHEDGRGDGLRACHPFGHVGNGLPEIGGDRLGEPRPDGGLAPGPDLPQPVDGEPGGDPDQVGARIADGRSVGGVPAQPRVLHHVLGVGQAPEHAVGDRTEQRAVLLENVGRGREPCAVAVGGHGSIPSIGPRGVEGRRAGAASQ